MRKIHINADSYLATSFVDFFFMVQSVLKTGLVLVFLGVCFCASAQDVSNELEYRSELGLSYKFSKKVKVSFTPELRFDDSFDLDKYLFEGGLSYKLVDFLSLEGAYRYIINPRDKKETKYSHQFALAAEAEKEFGRFNTAFKIKYTNDSDDDSSDEKFLRYKLSADYDIPKCKLTPEISMEAYQQLGEDGEMYKMRFSAGADYKLFKNNYLGLAYKLDYYYTKYLNKHIVALGYKIKF